MESAHACYSNHLHCARHSTSNHFYTHEMMMLMMLITMHCNGDVDDDGGGSVNGGQTQITHILCLLSAPRLTPSPLTTILYQITMMKR